MNDSRNQPLTFRTLAESQGICLPDPLPQEWPLEIWFASVCDLPLEALSLEDLAKACRQRIDLPHIVPLYLLILSQEQLAGELYDGELLSAIIRLPSDYWHEEPEHLERVLPLIYRALDEADEGLWKEILNFVKDTSPSR